MEQKEIDVYLNHLISIVYTETSLVFQRVVGGVVDANSSLYIGKKLSVEEIEKVCGLLKGHWKNFDSLRVVTCHYFVTRNLKEDLRSYWLDMLINK